MLLNFKTNKHQKRFLKITSNYTPLKENTQQLLTPGDLVIISSSVVYIMYILCVYFPRSFCKEKGFEVVTYV